MQAICTSHQTDNHIDISSLNFTGQMLFLTPNQQCRSTEGTVIRFFVNWATVFLKTYCMNHVLLIVLSYAVVCVVMNTPIVVVCIFAVPERPNITNVFTWLDEEQDDPQPVIYVEWTVSDAV